MIYGVTMSFVPGLLNRLFKEFYYIDVTIRKFRKPDSGREDSYVISISVPYIDVTALPKSIDTIYDIADQLGGSVTRFEYNSREQLVNAVISIDK